MLFECSACKACVFFQEKFRKGAHDHGNGIFLKRNTDFQCGKILIDDITAKEKVVLVYPTCGSNAVIIVIRELLCPMRSDSKSETVYNTGILVMYRAAGFIEVKPKRL